MIVVWVGEKPRVHVSVGVFTQKIRQRCTVTNRAAVPAYPVMIDVTDEKRRCILSENFFLLAPGETKTVRVTVDEGDVGEITVSCWNGKTVYA